MAKSILVINPTDAQLAKARKSFPNHQLVCAAFSRQKYIDHPKIDQFELLDNFLTVMFESRLLEVSEGVMHSLVDIPELKELFNIDGQNLLHDSRFHYMTQIVYPISRASMQVEGLLNKYPNIDHAFAGGHYYSALRSRKIPVWQLSRRSYFRSLGALFIPLFSLLYKLIYIPLQSRWISRRDSINVKNVTILIGNLNEFVQFKNELAARIPLKSSDYLLLHPMRNYNQFKKFKKIYPDNFTFYPLDRLLQITDYFRIIGRYVPIIMKFSRILRKFYKPTIYGGDVTAALYSLTFRFYLYFTLVALKNYYSMIRLMNSVEGNPDVIFSHPHTYLMNTANNCLRRHGVKTMTFNHGLIQSPLQLITETSRSYSASAYDLSVMKSVSRDEKFIHILIESTNIKIDVSFQADPKILILGNTFTSSELFEYHKDYLSYVKTGLAKVGLDHIVPLYKPHPKENLTILSAYLDEINFKIRVTDSNLDAAFNECNLVITPISTALIECNKKGLPFLVYQYHAESLETFFNEIPQSILFDTAEIFHNAYRNLNSMSKDGLSDLFNGLHQKYYRGESKLLQRTTTVGNWNK